MNKVYKLFQAELREKGIGIRRVHYKKVSALVKEIKAIPEYMVVDKGLDLTDNMLDLIIELRGNDEADTLFRHSKCGSMVIMEQMKCFNDTAYKHTITVIREKRGKLSTNGVEYYTLSSEES